ncbi:hypothetical protein M422DRAFT_39663, partial [Sphaerobolus stellatus SS14]
MEHQRKKERDAMQRRDGKRQNTSEGFKEERRKYALNIGNKLRRLQPRISEEPTPADDVRRDEHAEGRDVDVHGESSSTAR